MPDVTTTPPATPIDVGPEPEPKKRPRQRKRARQAISLVLENSGSVARDHLASERTFLAYIRTSLLFASKGALVQLFAIASPGTPLARFVRPLGATLALVVLAIEPPHAGQVPPYPHLSCSPRSRHRHHHHNSLCHLGLVKEVASVISRYTHPTRRLCTPPQTPHQIQCDPNPRGPPTRAYIVDLSTAIVSQLYHNSS